MAKRKAKITLVGPLSLSVGRYRFFKDRPVLTEDEELLRYCELNPDFKVSILSDEGEAPKKALPRSEVRETKKPEPKPAPKQEPVSKAKPEPVAVKDDDEVPSSLSDEESEEEMESSSRLTRKKKRTKGDDA